MDTLGFGDKMMAGRMASGKQDGLVRLQDKMMTGRMASSKQGGLVSLQDGMVDRMTFSK